MIQAKDEQMPALENTFLFAEPMAHYLEYGSVVLHQIIEANKRPMQTIVELVGVDASPENALKQLRTMNPIVFSLVGHGNETTTSLECTAVLVNTESPELDLLKDKVVSLVSCLTAQQLGPAIIDAGAKAYVGYKEEFWFFIGDAAGTTRAVQSPFLSAFQFEASLLQGKSVRDARNEQLAKFDEEITYWTSGDGKNDVNSMELSRIQELNKSNCVFLGEGSITPSPVGAVVQAGFANPPLLFGLAGIIIGYGIYRELTA